MFGRPKRPAHKSRRLAAFAIIATLVFIARKLLRSIVKKHQVRVVANEPFPYLESVSPRLGKQIEEMRFLAGALSAPTINDALSVTDAINPVRVYASLASGSDAAARVTYSIKHMEKLGGFERKVILVICPTGRGYAHPVVPESIELATHGDCASIVAQYHDDRTVRSIQKLDDGAEVHRLLLEAIHARISSKAEPRPLVVVYGESLGAWASQEGLLHLSDEALSWIDAGAWSGTPYASRQAQELQDRLYSLGHAAPMITHPRELDHQLARFAFMANADDPISYFTGLKVLYRPQPWVRHMGKRWVPGWTMTRAMLDIEAATRPRPGVRESAGHDYRATSPELLRRLLGIGHSEAGQIEAFLDESERTRRARMGFLHGAVHEKAE